MGYQKFKLSDMIPNSWFYKLKDFSKQPKTHSHSLSSTTTTTTTTTTKVKKHRLPPPPAPPSTAKTTSPPPPLLHSQPRKSYHFTRDFPLPPPDDPPLSPPRKSKTSYKSRKPTKKNTATSVVAASVKQNQFSLSSSVSGRCTCRDTATLQSHRSKTPESDANVENAPPKTTEHFDIVIDFDNYKYNTPGRPGTHLNSGQLLESLSTKSYKNNGFDFQLPPIITKPKQSTTQEEKPVAPATSKRFTGSPPTGVRLRINSPRIMGLKQGKNGKNGSRRSVKKRMNLSESFAVVKSSDDPQRDFRESMVEMIVQNNLRGSKDLEDLLACYLLLNSDEYHDVIIKVFKQIWYDLSRLRDQKLVS